MSFSVQLKYGIYVVVALSFHHIFPRVLPAGCRFQRSLVCQTGHRCHSKSALGGSVCNLCHHLPWQNMLLKQRVMHSLTFLLDTPCITRRRGSCFKNPGLCMCEQFLMTHVWQSRACSLVRPPSAKAFVKAASRVASRAESGEVRGLNTVLLEQAAPASKGIWSAWPGQTELMIHLS